jgi:hypothetical protein
VCSPDNHVFNSLPLGKCFLRMIYFWDPTELESMPTSMLMEFLTVLFDFSFHVRQGYAKKFMFHMMRTGTDDERLQIARFSLHMKQRLELPSHAFRSSDRRLGISKENLEMMDYLNSVSWKAKEKSKNISIVIGSNLCHVSQSIL